jgi:hypothetical protein
MCGQEIEQGQLEQRLVLSCIENCMMPQSMFVCNIGMIVLDIIALAVCLMLSFCFCEVAVSITVYCLVLFFRNYNMTLLQFRNRNATYLFILYFRYFFAYFRSTGKSLLARPCSSECSSFLGLIFERFGLETIHLFC